MKTRISSTSYNMEGSDDLENERAQETKIRISTNGMTPKQPAHSTNASRSRQTFRAVYPNEMIHQETSIINQSQSTINQQNNALNRLTDISLSNQPSLLTKSSISNSSTFDTFTSDTSPNKTFQDKKESGDLEINEANPLEQVSINLNNMNHIGYFY